MGGVNPAIEGEEWGRPSGPELEAVAVAAGGLEEVVAGAGGLEGGEERGDGGGWVQVGAGKNLGVQDEEDLG